VKYAPSGDRTRLYFEYNALIERTRKTDWGSAGEDQRNYVFDGIEKIRVSDDSSAIERYILGPSAISGIHGALKYKDLSAKADYSYQQNNVLSVLGLSNAGQDAAQSYLYDAFGNLLESIGSLNQFLKFSAKEYDAKIAQCNYFLRQYNPYIGILITVDPLFRTSAFMIFNPIVHVLDTMIFLNGNKHEDLLPQYRYNIQNPVNFLDLFGLYTVTINISDEEEAHQVYMEKYSDLYIRVPKDNALKAIEKAANKSKNGCIEDLVLSGHGGRGGVSVSPGTSPNAQFGYDGLSQSELERLCESMCPYGNIYMAGCTTGNDPDDWRNLECLSWFCQRGIKTIGMRSDIGYSWDHTWPYSTGIPKIKFSSFFTPTNSDPPTPGCSFTGFLDYHNPKMRPYLYVSSLMNLGGRKKGEYPKKEECPPELGKPS